MLANRLAVPAYPETVAPRGNTQMQINVHRSAGFYQHVADHRPVAYPLPLVSTRLDRRIVPTDDAHFAPPRWADTRAMLRIREQVSRPDRSCVTGLLLLISLVTLSSGCDSGQTRTTSQASASAGDDNQDGLTPRDILERMAEVYRGAESYLDNAQYFERFVRRGDGIEHDVPPHILSVVFQRPNRIRVNRLVPETTAPGLDASVACNGQILRSFVSDYKQQVLEQPVPDLFIWDNLTSDGAVRRAITPVPVENLYPQLDLLFASESHPPRLFSSGEMRRLSSEELDGVRCYRVEIDRPEEGPRVLWIEQETFLLQRMDMPTRQVRAVMDPQGLLSELALWIEFQDAAINVTVDPDMFEMEIPKDAVRVRRLIASPPPPPQAPFGKIPSQYRFVQLDGSPVTGETWAGKVVVVDFWFTGCQPCRYSIPALEKLYQHYRSDSRFVMVAVSVDGRTVPSEVIASTLRGWGGTMPIVRDLTDAGSKHFNVKVWPTTLLMGPEGKIHRVAIGARDGYDDWHESIDALLAGEDVAAKSLEDHSAEVAKFEAAVAAATIEGSGIDEPTKETDQLQAKQGENAP